MKKYIRSTGQIIEINKMDSKHVYNARNKLAKTVIYKYNKNGSLVMDKSGKETQTYKDLNEELKKRNPKDYLKPIYITK
tara:strand:+ start:382 stop:618 length:237 start_codon:yes stop_codon:yes gene_type:complete